MEKCNMKNYEKNKKYPIKGEKMKKSVTKILAYGLSGALVLYTGFLKTDLKSIQTVQASEKKPLTDMDEETEMTTVEEVSETVKEGTKQYIVTMQDNASYQKMEKTAENKELLTEQEIPDQTELEENNILLLQMDDTEAQQVENMQGVQAVEEDMEMTANEVVEPDESLVNAAVEKHQKLDFNQWNLKAVHLPQIEADTATGAATNGIKEKKLYTGKGVKVAVLDSGVSYNSAYSVTKRVDLTNVMEESNPLFDDGSGHGTGIAGIIAGNGNKGELSGIAPEAELYSVRVLDTENKAPVSRIVNGIYWCIANNMDVINMSFGMSQNSRALKEAVQEAQKAGIILVAAAGNHGTEADKADYPAAYGGVIAVGASDGNNQMTEFTSHGKELDVLAPGEKVWTYSSLAGYTAVDGTSIAAAHVTGAVAQLLEKYPEADGTFIKQLLRSTAKVSENSQNVGVMDVTNALETGEHFDTTDIEKDTQPVQMEQEAYDTDGIISGCWSRKDHKADLNIEHMEMINTAAKNTDVDLKKNKAFHGSKNYVANLHLLYLIASDAKNIDSANVQCNGKSTELGDISNIKAEIKRVWKPTYWNADSLAKKKWMTLGIAIHILGDTYAHRTMIPSGEINKFKKSDMADWTGFYNSYCAGTLEFRDVKWYQTDGDTTKYEDNTALFRNRYEISQIAVKDFINTFLSDSGFSPYTFYGNRKFEGALNNLYAYAQAAGYSDRNDALFCNSTPGYYANTVKGEPGKYDLGYTEYDYTVC